MKCSELFKDVIALWPSKIAINKSDADQLNKLYWAAEAKFNSDSQHWLNVGSWAFHQALGKYLDSRNVKHDEVINVSDVPIELFHSQMLFNLAENCWAKERSEYLGP